MSYPPPIPDGHEVVLLPPDDEAVREAARLAGDLRDIATQDGRAAQDRLSQSDRLVIVAARCGEIVALLRWRREVHPKPEGQA